MIDNSTVEIISHSKELGVFYGISKEGTPVWGRVTSNTITELHPIYARNHHSAIKDAMMRKQ